MERKERILKTLEDYELIAYEFEAEMDRQHVRYAEATFSPSTHEYALGVPYETYFRGLAQGRTRAKRDFGVEIAWAFDIVRDVPDRALRKKRAEYTLDIALQGRMEGVVALGLGGIEANNPPEEFAPWFERALSEGLHSTTPRRRDSWTRKHLGSPAHSWGGTHRPRRTRY